MPRQYKREASLVVAATASTSPETEIKAGLQIEGLRIRFELIKDLQGFPNLLMVEVFNLSKASQAQIENEFDTVFLNVGYEGNVKLLFNGTIKNVFHRKEGVDTITVIYAGDGQRDFDQSFSSFTLAEGATVGDIINRTVSDFEGLQQGFIEGVNVAKEKLLGVSVSGKTSEVLDNLAEENDFNWSVQNGKVNVLGNDAVEDIEFRISATTGMINSPIITEIGADVTFLLNPEVQPGRVINIEAVGAEIALNNIQFRQVSRTRATGRYKVLKCTYVGDTRANDWFCSAVGKTI